MLLSLLLSTASANQATRLPEPPDLEPQAAASIWTAPPQLSIYQARRLGDVRRVAAIGSVFALSAATLSTWVMLDNNSSSFNPGLARANVVAAA
ncbi:MAG: hypothetical protein ACI9VR_002828 [Cognaticolwellia sp.]|jgi:hypothetical protein